MIFDAENLFSDEQAVTSTAPSTDYIDLGVDRDVGVGEPAYLVILVDVAVTQSGSGTVTFALQTDDVSTFDSALVALYTSAAIPKAALTAGAVPVKVVIPPGTKRYLRVNYTVSETLLTGKFTAGIVKDIQAFRAYPGGFEVGA